MKPANFEEGGIGGTPGGREERTKIEYEHTLYKMVVYLSRHGIKPDHFFNVKPEGHRATSAMRGLVFYSIYGTSTCSLRDRMKPDTQSQITKFSHSVFPATEMDQKACSTPAGVSNNDEMTGQSFI